MPKCGIDGFPEPALSGAITRPGDFVKERLLLAQGERLCHLNELRHIPADDFLPAAATRLCSANTRLTKALPPSPVRSRQTLDALNLGFISACLVELIVRRHP